MHSNNYRVVPMHSNNYYIGISLLHNVHNLFSTSNTITAIKTTKKGVAEHVASMGETNTSENVYGNPGGERQLGRSRRRWMILMWILWKYGVDWIREDQDREEEGGLF